jgi:hypothetical protein
VTLALDKAVKLALDILPDAVRNAESSDSASQ